jgi:hypothetical protein
MIVSPSPLGKQHQIRIKPGIEQPGSHALFSERKINLSFGGKGVKQKDYFSPFFFR